MADATASTKAAASGAVDDGYKWKAFMATGLSLFTMVMSFSIVFLGLSSIAEDFGITLRAVTWVVIAQSLTVSAVMLPLGRVSDIIGRKKFHLIGIALFTGGAIFCAFSPDLPTLIVGRVIMAVGASMGQAVSTAIVTSVFPPHERGKGLGSQSTAVATGGASGPIIAGVLLHFWGWESLFIFMAIPAGIAFIWGLYILDDKRIGSFQGKKRDPYDWPGAALSAVGMVLLIMTINNPFNLSWGSPAMIGGITGAVVAFALFVWWELRTPYPMLDLRLFKNTIYRYAIATRYLAFMGITATAFMMPVFLQDLRGLSELGTGGIMFINAVGMGVAAQVSGRLSDQFGFRRFTFMGFAVLIATSFTFSTIGKETPVWFLMPVLFLNGIGMGLWSSPNMSATMGAVPRTAYGAVSAFVNLTRNLGNTMGQAITAAIITGVMVAKGFDIQLSAIETTPGADAAFLDGWRIAYYVVVVFASLALVAAFFTKESRARDSH
jgi:EmrB/QacA subfamily drug resistance transporter